VNYFPQRVFPADVTRRSFLALGNAAETSVMHEGIKVKDIFPYKQKHMKVDNVFFNIDRWNDLKYRDFYLDKRKKREALVFRAQYKQIEKRMIETSDFVTLSNSNKDCFSIVFAEIIKSSAGLFEVLSKYVYSQIFEVNKTKDIKGLNIFDYLSLDKFGRFSLQEISSIYLLSPFDSAEVYQPFHALKDWDKESKIKDNQIPKWWTSYNKIKHSNEGLEKYATLENSLGALGGVFVFLQSIYSFGYMSGCPITVDSVVFGPVSEFYSINYA